MGAVTGHALFPAILSGFLKSCSENKSGDPGTEKGYDPVFFTEEEFEVIGKIIDVILPETNTRSATSVLAHHFIDEVFAKCLTEEFQLQIKEGFAIFKKKFEESNNLRELIAETDLKAFSNQEEHAWFIPVKQYALIGFFTSEEGTTRASNYVPVPGDYKGEIEADESTLNYGLTNLHYYL